jgi:hypothetical protein
MMKLIKKGTKPEDRYQATCKECGCVWEVLKSELDIQFHRNEFCIQTQSCPECRTYGLNFEKVVE